MYVWFLREWGGPSYGRHPVCMLESIIMPEVHIIDKKCNNILVIKAKFLEHSRNFMKICQVDRLQSGLQFCLIAYIAYTTVVCHLNKMKHKCMLW